MAHLTEVKRQWGDRSEVAQVGTSGTRRNITLPEVFPGGRLGQETVAEVCHCTRAI